MPRTPTDYSETHFYKIVCRDTNIENMYIGHTVNFTKKKNHHKSICNKENCKNHNQYVYQFIRENGGWNNFQMVLINIECCKNKLEALKREREYIEINKVSLNHYPPMITDEERRVRITKYNEENKEYQYYQKKIYYEIHQDEIKQRRAQNHHLNKDEINRKQREYIKENGHKYKKTNQIYYNNNKESLLKQKQEYYKLNRDKILQDKKTYHIEHKEHRNNYNKMYYREKREKYWIGKGKKLIVLVVQVSDIQT